MPRRLLRMPRVATALFAHITMHVRLHDKTEADEATTMHYTLIRRDMAKALVALI